MDKFPEAFSRFEEDVDISKIHGMTELKLMIAHWMGRGWKNSPAQNRALRIEAERYGIAKTHEAKRPLEKPHPIPRKILPRAPPEFVLKSGQREPTYTAVAHPSWFRHETVNVKGRRQERYRDVKSGRFVRRP